MAALLSVKHPILAEQQCHGNNVKTNQKKRTRINFYSFSVSFLSDYNILLFKCILLFVEEFTI